MDTYEICEPDEDTSTLDSARSFAAELTATTAVQLQLIEAPPMPLRQDLHPSLLYTDVDSFLARLND